jgi:acylphosphatase
MSQVARHVRVTGRVQGVFFRAWTCQEARELGVKGWVWNTNDGSVEARLQGEEVAVEQLIDRMRQGPESAQVEKVEIEETEVQSIDRFEIRN